MCLFETKYRDSTCSRNTQVGLFSDSKNDHLNHANSDTWSEYLYDQPYSPLSKDSFWFQEPLSTFESVSFYDFSLPRQWLAGQLPTLESFGTGTTRKTVTTKKIKHPEKQVETFILNFR
jgi:hypothetical protein